MTWHDLQLRIRALLRLRRAEQELDEELQFHIEMETRKNLAKGLPAGEASRLARIQFGGVDWHKEECRTIRGTQLVETAWQDIRYALRGFRQSPAFALTVIGTIGLALGLNTTIFTIFNAYVLKPVSVRDPNSLYSYTWTNLENRRQSFSWPQFVDFQANNRAFTEVAATRTLVIPVEGRVLVGELVTGNYFRMLGVGAAFGRTLLPEDSASPGSNAVIVISHSAWLNIYGGAPDIIGRKVMLQGYPFDVIGVIKPEFAGLGMMPRDFWAPVSVAAQFLDGPDLFGPESPARLHVVGRLAPDLTVDQANAALLGWARAQTEQLPAAERAAVALLESQATAVPLTISAAAGLLPIFSAFGLVLIIACGNVANMMLSRALARQREIGIRLSLGAARFRLIRQLLTESLLFAIPAAAVGFLLSEATIRYGQLLVFQTLPADLVMFIRIVPLDPDFRVFAFMLLAAAASTLLFGLAPALQVTRSSLVSVSRGDFSQDHRPARLRNWLVGSQVTCCVLLLICAAVLLRGAVRVRNLDVGVEAKGVIILEVRDSARSRVLQHLASQPMVHSVGAAASIPLNGAFGSLPMTPLPVGESVATLFNLVSPEFFPALGIPILRGRNFTAEEARAQSPVAIISASTASRFFPNQDALGRSIRIAPKDASYRDKRLPAYTSVRVVGIARDIACGSAFVTTAQPCVNLPASPLLSGASMFVKLDPGIPAGRQKLDAALSSAVPGSIDQILSLSDFLAANIYPLRAASAVCAAIGAVALLLTLSGVYGVLSYLVTQRRKEIGIRVALGATPLSVIGLVLRQSMRLSIIGAAVGCLLALGVSRLLAAHLTIMDPFDSHAYAAGILTVIAASFAAAYFPSRRAAQVDPVRTLRSD